MSQDYSDLGLPDSTLIKPTSGTVTLINSDTQIEDSSIDGSKLVDSLLFNEAVGYTGAGTVSYTNSGASFNAWADITSGLSLTFSTAKTANVFFYHVGNYEMDYNSTDTTIVGEVRMVLDDTQIGTIIMIYAGLTASPQNKLMSTYSLYHTSQVPSGTHTVKMQWRSLGGSIVLAGTTYLSLNAGEQAANLGFLVLGK